MKGDSAEDFSSVEGTGIGNETQIPCKLDDDDDDDVLMRNIRF